MLIEETKKDFQISFDYNHKIVAAVKGIPGAWYSSANKIWHVPLYRQKEVNDLQILFGGHAKALMKNEEVGDLDPLPSLDVEIPLTRPLFEFQKSGVAYNLKQNKTIIGDDMGLGKTTQAIATVIAADMFPCLIICPATLKLNWQQEWKIVAGRRAMILNDRVKSSWEMYNRVKMVDVFIVNYESLPKFFVKEINKTEGEELRLKHIVFRDNINTFKSVIIDEIHRCKSHTTRQSKLCMGIAKGKEMVLGLSGTILVNKPKDLFSPLAIIDRLKDIIGHIPQPKDRHGKLTDFSGHRRFLERYCDGGTGATNLKELNYRLNKFCYYRRQKQEVLKDLPDKIRQIMLCDITNRKEYNKAATDFVDYLKSVRGHTDPEIKKKLRGEMMVKMGILKQISARGKMEAVKEFVEEIMESGEKVVLFAYLKEIINEVVNIFPHALVINGDVDEQQRHLNVQRFQNDPARNIIICNYKSAGVGLNLTAATNVGFIEFPWTYADCDQCEDRCYRIGTKNNVHASYFLGVDTIDQYCYDLIQSKKSLSFEISGDSDFVETEFIDKMINLFNQK